MFKDDQFNTSLKANFWGVHHAHSEYFEQAMKSKAVAQEFFSLHLPEKIEKTLDFESLDFQSANFFSSNKSRFFDNSLFQCGFLGGSKAWLALLAERPSNPVVNMPFRVLQYSMAVWENHIKLYGRGAVELILPPIYCLLLNRGGEFQPPFLVGLLDRVDAYRPVRSKLCLRMAGQCAAQRGKHHKGG